MSDLEFQVTLSNISKTAKKISLRLDRLSKLIDKLNMQEKEYEMKRMELQAILDQQCQYGSTSVKH